MKKKILIIMLFIITAFQLQAEDFKLVGQWKHQEIMGSRAYSLINQENQVVAGFRMVGNRIISAEKLIKFAPRGQGPGDLAGFKAAFTFKGDLAIAERSDKIKIFTMKNGSYVWKETKWLKQGKWPQIVKDAIFFDNKFFMAGLYPIAKKGNLYEYGYLKIYNQDGQPLKQVINESFAKTHKFHLMSYYVAHHNDNVFFMKANELKVHIVSAKKMTLENEIKLEVPGFYKIMPETFYARKKKKTLEDTFLKDIQEWDTGYSSIQKVLVHDGKLVVQTRTANPEMKKFAILFYNADTFKLEKTILLDDLLLGAKDGKYYCFANGNPSMDEDIDDCNINIYSFRDQK